MTQKTPSPKQPELLICTPNGVAQAPALTHKTCSRCGEARPITAYNRETKKQGGFAAWCKPCKSADQDRRRRELLMGDPDWRLRRKTFARLARLMAAGVLDKPERCPFCGAAVPGRELQADFADPTDPHSVTWRCRRCALAVAGKAQLAFCRWCRDPFVAQTTSVRRGGGRYCSVRCRNAWMRTTAEHVRQVPPGERTSAEQIYVDDRF